MTEKTMIRVKNVKKSFILPHQKITTLKGAFLNFFQGGNSYERQQVLGGVSLEIKEGEFFGIVGRNGSGKSTLLKLLAQIYEPNEGSIEINGVITPFIELGVGFNQDLTGRENVYLNAALLGFTRPQVDGMYDDIVRFAELERFMDQKLKNYSSGMQVRLAFSVAIQARTDILLIDEVLAVGDSNFQKKCFDVFKQFKNEGRTIVFISHSMDMVTEFCDRVALLDKGLIKLIGEPEVVAAEYQMLNDERQRNNTDRLNINTPREARIVQSVLSSFTDEDTLVELGSADGRHVDLLRSLGVDVVGVDPSYKKSNSSRLKTIEDTIAPTGLLVLDNKRSISTQYLCDMFALLREKKYRSIKKVYIHLPFHLYQLATIESKPPHLGDPIPLHELATPLEAAGFVEVNRSVYGTDAEYQYIEATFIRLGSEEQVQLWESSVN